MNVKEINQALATGALDRPGLFPHLEELSLAPHIFPLDFGLKELPKEAGVLLIRGPRQYGKSTWLEQELRRTLREWGPGSAYYLNGDEIADVGGLVSSIRELAPAFAQRTGVRRLFIDEVTAVAKWEEGLKRLIDAGELRSILVVTTGSKATDLRRGAERLPGRKGRLERTHYLFTPVSYAAFKKVCRDKVGADVLAAYIMSGGSPAALGELAESRRLPEHRIGAVRDWIYGECAASGRARGSLLAILEHITRRGGSPIGQARLARECGLANNTVAAGYVELLADLMCVGSQFAWDPSRRVLLRRKPCKHPFINTLAAAAWHPARPRSIDDFSRLPKETQAMFLEWVVAQELCRRRAKAGEDMPEVSSFWQNKDHELDFVLAPDSLLEVKRGAASPLDFSWFPRMFPSSRLTVINARRFEGERVTGVTLEDFLLARP